MMELLVFSIESSKFPHQEYVSPVLENFPSNLLHMVLRPISPQIVTVKCFTWSDWVLKTLRSTRNSKRSEEFLGKYRMAERNFNLLSRSLLKS